MTKAQFAIFKKRYEGEIAVLEDRVKELLKDADDHTALGEERHANTIANLKSQAAMVQRSIDQVKEMIARAEAKLVDEGPGAAPDAPAAAEKKPESAPAA